MEISILNMHEHSEQEVFDFVVNHLLTQGEPSRFSGGSGYCRYRNEEGLSCAVGCLIPDSVYSEAMEGRDYWELVELKALPEAHGNLLNGLQYVHDNADHIEWAKKLRTLAQKRGLQFNFNASETR